MGMRRWLGALSLLAAFAGAAPALGAPALTPSRVISPARATVIEPSLAVSADGRTLAAWVAVRSEREAREFPSCGNSGYGPIDARLGAVAGGWGGVQALGADGEHPIAAVGANGTAALAWCSIERGHPSLYVSIAGPGRPFGRARLVPTGGEFPVGHPEGLEVQPDGRVVLIWSKTLEYELTPLKTRVEYALLSPRGGRPVTGAIAASSPGGAGTAETEAGDVLVTYGPASGEYKSQEVAQLTPAARAFAPSQAIKPRPGASIRAAAVSAGPGGAALVLNASEQQSTEEDGMSEQLPNGSFGPAAPTIPPPSQSPGEHFTDEYEGPEIAFPAGGERVAVWDSFVRRPAPTGPLEEGALVSVTLLAAVSPAGAGAFQAPVQLSVGQGLPLEFAVTAAGTATLALWTQDEHSCRQRVYAAIGALGTASVRVRALSYSYKLAKGECIEGGQLVLAGSGPYAIAGWMQGDALHVTTTKGESFADA